MADDALARLQSGAAEIAPEGGLVEKLSLGRPLRVKLGLDPTAPVVTLGWAVVLRKLRQFQDAGHQAVLIVGDFTARVGDPSGRSSTRRTVLKEQVDAFAEHVLSQFWKVIDRDRVELRRNSEWLEPLGVEDVLRLSASTTVARMLERDDFADRYAAKKPISLMEFLYPLLQGYDSVAVGADVELGGTDQLFNLLLGRELQKDVGQDPQIALTMPLLEGLDGVQKMSQSLGNYVGVDEPPENMFGKLMSIPDGVIARYELLCTDLGPEDNVSRGGPGRWLAAPEHGEAADGKGHRGPLPRSRVGGGGRAALRSRSQAASDPGGRTGCPAAQERLPGGAGRFVDRPRPRAPGSHGAREQPLGSEAAPGAGWCSDERAAATGRGSPDRGRAPRSDGRL